MTPVFSTLIFLLQQQFSGGPPNPEGAKGNIIAIIALVVSTITLGVVVLQLYLSWPPRRVTKMRAKTRKHKRVSHRAQQIVGRERRERLSQLAWCGEG